MQHALLAPTPNREKVQTSVNSAHKKPTIYSVSVIQKPDPQGAHAVDALYSYTKYFSNTARRKRRMSSADTIT
jgi:hypothetical protein